MDETNALLDEVQELTWALVDEQATEEQVHNLEALLLENDEARRIYVMCMQLHADLHYMLNKKARRLPPALEKLIKAEQGKKKSPLPVSAIDMPSTASHMPTSNGCT
jgi:hypothetical protein